jgi:hypothetical protein
MPTGLVANVGVHDGEVEVSWNANGEFDLDYYRLERSTSPNFLLGRVDVDTMSTSHLDSGLTPGETYYYRVVAIDEGSNESDPSSAASATALDLAPAAPSNLVVVGGPGDGETTVTWDENTETDMYRYEVQRDIYELFTHSPVTYSVFGTSVVDSGLETDVTYYYRVFAIDVAGNWSEPSEVVEITIPSTTSVTEEEHLGASFSLAGPNPSSTGEVAFAFSVPEGGAEVSIDLYDVSGRLVRSVVDRHHRGGVYEAHWDGRSRGGSQVGSGVYFCLTRIGEWTDRSKVLIAR